MFVVVANEYYCEKQYDTYSVDNLCYIYHSNPVTWSFAVQNCFDTAGSLASAETVHQQEFLYNISKGITTKFTRFIHTIAVFNYLIIV